MVSCKLRPNNETTNTMLPVDAECLGEDIVAICRMVKRRLRDAGLPGVLSPHSFRVTTITVGAATAWLVIWEVVAEAQ